MSYTKQNFTDGQVLTAEQMNHIEDGIAAAESAAGSAGGLGETEKANMLILFAAAKDTSAETLAAYNALETAWGGGTAAPDQPETGEKTILTTKKYDKWSIYTPLCSSYNLPLTPKVNLTLKGLKFKIQSEAAATLSVGIYDTVESKTLETVTAEIALNQAAGNEVDVALNTALVADRFYKISIGTSDSSQVLHYPGTKDEDIVENEYFSISRDDASDYQWSNPKMRYGGYVTIEV